MGRAHGFHCESGRRKRACGQPQGVAVIILVLAVIARPGVLAVVLSGVLVVQTTMLQSLTLFPVITGQTGLDPIFGGAADFTLHV